MRLPLARSTSASTRSSSRCTASFLLSKFPNSRRAPTDASAAAFPCFTSASTAFNSSFAFATSARAAATAAASSFCANSRRASKSATSCLSRANSCDTTASAPTPLDPLTPVESRDTNGLVTGSIFPVSNLTAASRSGIDSVSPLLPSSRLGPSTTDEATAFDPSSPGANPFGARSRNFAANCPNLSRSPPFTRPRSTRFPFTYVPFDDFKSTTSYVPSSCLNSSA